MPGPAPDYYQKIEATADMFGAQSGRALQSFAEQVGRLGEALSAQQTKADNEAAVADANAGLLAYAKDQAPYDAAYYSLTGKKAVDATPAYMQSLDDLRAKHVAAMPSEKAKVLLQNELTRSAVTDIGTASKFAATQQKAYQNLMTDSRVQKAIFDSAKNFNDDNFFNSNLEVINREIDFKAASNGWDKDTTDLEKEKVQSALWSARIKAMSVSDPWKADELFKANGDAIAPDARAEVQQAIKTAKDTTGVHADAQQFRSGGPAARGEVINAMRVQPVAASVDLVHVDPRLPDLLVRGANYLPDGYTVRINGGYSATGHSANSQHHIIGRGALDVTILDPNGHDIPNRGIDRTGMYGRLAQGMYTEMLRTYPELRGQFAWGGTFGITNGSTVQDLMHFDLGGPRGRLNPQTGVIGPPTPGIAGGADITRYMGTGGRYAGTAGPSELVRRVINVESHGQTGAVSSAGALGIMQVLPSTARRVAARLGIPYNETALRFDNQYNMTIGTAYLNMLLKRYGNETLAVAAYNAGEGNVDKWIKENGDPRSGAISMADWVSRIPIQETKNYVAKVNGAVPLQGDIQTNFRAGPIVGGAAAGGDNRRDWPETEAAVRAFAQAKDPNNPDYLDALLTQVHSDWVRDNESQNAAQTAAFDLIMKQVIEKNMTSMEQVVQDDTLRDAWNKMDGSQVRQVNDAFKSNQQGYIADNPQRQANYFEIRGKMDASLDYAKSVNPYDPKLDLTKEARDQIDTRKREILTAAAAGAKPTKVDISGVMTDMHDALDAAGLVAHQNMLQPQLDLIAKNRAIFQGQLIKKLEDESAQKYNNQPVPADRQLEIANELLTKVPMNPIYTKNPDQWFRRTYFPGAKGGTAMEFEINDLPGFMKKYNLTQSAAITTLLAQVPDDIEKNIRESWIRQNGYPPTALDVIRSYGNLIQAGQYTMPTKSVTNPSELVSPAPAPVTRSVPPAPPPAPPTAGSGGGVPTGG